MSAATPPLSAAPTPEAKAVLAGDVVLGTPIVGLQGESVVDKVSSLLMAFVLATSFLAGFLGIWLLTQKGFDKRQPAMVELIEVSGDGSGGSPDGVMGGKQDINVAGGDAAQMASNNMEDASEFEEPNIEETATGLIDPFVEGSADEMASLDIAEAIPGAVAGQVATGRRASKLGNGLRGLGTGGPGDGGYSRENRWTITFPPGQTPDEYAKQLDAFGVELAVKATPTSMEYVSKFTSGTPERRIGQAKSDMRLYFSWQGAGRKGHDVELLRRAGVDVGNKDIFQFFPKAVEDQLIQAEVQFKGRQPAEIKKTVFTVVPQGGGYGFNVVSQETIR